MINEKRIPELRRSLMAKLLEMFSPDTEITLTRRPIISNKGVVTSHERIITVCSKGETVELKGSDFMRESEIDHVFKIETSKEISTFFEHLEKRETATLADLVEIILITKVLRMRIKPKKKR